MNDRMTIAEALAELARYGPAVWLGVLNIGGYAASYMAREILEISPDVDFIISGEGEIVFENLLYEIEHDREYDKVNGLTYRNQGCIVSNAREMRVVDMDTLPMQARDMIKQYNMNTAMISAARGCLHNCSFCCSHDFWQCDRKTNWRGRKPNAVVQEIKMLIENYNIHHFRFIDNTAEDPEIGRIWSIARLILKEECKIHYTMFIRGDFYKVATTQIMQDLADSGLEQVFIGIEAGNDADLAVYHKGCSVEDNLKTIKMCRLYDIEVVIGFININPYSTFHGLRENRIFLFENGFELEFYEYIVYNLYRGAHLYNQLKKDELIIDETRNEYQFRDARIKVLAEFIRELQKNKNFNLLRTHVIECKNRQIYRINNSIDELSEEGQWYVLQYKRRINEILKDIAEKDRVFYDSLLDLAEKHWDARYAEQLRDNYVSEKYVRKCCMELRRAQARCIDALTAIPSDYQIYKNVIVPNYI